MATIAAGDSDFEEKVLQSGIPVLVDFDRGSGVYCGLIKPEI